MARDGTGRVRGAHPDWRAHPKALRLMERDPTLIALALLEGIWRDPVDDAGRFRANPVYLRLHCFGGLASMTPEQINDGLALLEELRLVHLYEAEGGRYGVCHDWFDWQRVDHPTLSMMPPPPPEICRCCDPEEVEATLKDRGYSPANARRLLHAWPHYSPSPRESSARPRESSPKKGSKGPESAQDGQEDPPGRSSPSPRESSASPRESSGGHFNPFHFNPFHFNPSHLGQNAEVSASHPQPEPPSAPAQQGNQTWPCRRDRGSFARVCPHPERPDAATCSKCDYYERLPAREKQKLPQIEEPEQGDGD